jgi:hypothetical protein
MPSAADEAYVLPLSGRLFRAGQLEGPPEGVFAMPTDDSILVRNHYAHIKMTFKKHLYGAEGRHLSYFHH